MTETFSCGDPAALVSYLYDEIEAGEREVVAAHVAVCASCARELASLSGTRRQLATWKVPHAALGLRVSSELEKAPAQAWWRQPLPAWMQMAAAVLLFATGVAFGVARGTSQNAARAETFATSTAPTSETGVSSSELSQLEERLRAEMRELRDTAPVPVASKPARNASDDAAVLTQVRALIQESEERQRRELALRTAQLMRDVENQRRVDLTQVQQTWGQLQGLTGAEVQQQRVLLNELARRVSLQR